MSDKPEITARPASTVLLIRDGEQGLEVFMVVRNRAIDFAGGALVFPGGRVEPDDVAIAGGPGDEVSLDAFRVAGIRETFEECGVLLARPPGCPVMIGAETLLRAEDKHRAAMNRGERTLSELLAAEQLQPAVDAMLHFAHWVTPKGRAKRFDTQFFLAAAPPDHPIHATEIFGPVLPVVALPDLAAAIAWVAGRPRPLAVYLFGATTQEEAAIAAGTRSGALVANRCVEYAAFADLAFGGTGASGFGRRNGEAGFLEFSLLRARVTHGRWSLARLLDPPRGTRQRALVRRLLR